MSSDDPIGTVRREVRGFAHVILLDQPFRAERWLLIDAYGPVPGEPLLTDEQVESWPVVYTPMDDGQWEAQLDEDAETILEVDRLIACDRADEALNRALRKRP